jgi:hypothetical protein
VIEWLWGLLLLAALLEREARLLAVLLAAKWALNYAAAGQGVWFLPPLIDLAAGSLGVWLAMRLDDWRGPVLASVFVVVPIIHAWHWILWAEGVWVGVQYFWFMLGLFTAQVVILGGPGVRDRVHRVVDRMAFSHRRGVAGVPSPPRVAGPAGSGGG